MKITFIAKTAITLGLSLVLGLVATLAQAETYLPFVLASNEPGKIADKLEGTKKALLDNGFEVAGEYSPYDGAYIVVVTNNELKKAAAAAAHDRGGYIAAQRIALTELGGKVQVSYTNPVYMSYAYRVNAKLPQTTSGLKKALGFVQAFGPKEGMAEKDLKKYHYAFGMEYFDEPLDLASSASHDAMVAEVEKNLNARHGGAGKVYKIKIPGTAQTLFGVSMHAPKKGNQYMDEGFIMSKIDFKPLRSTAHLPYEILVKGKEAEALHARFRIAINFPDLSMVMGENSFFDIMPTPDAIQELLTEVAGGELEDDDT